MNIQFIQGYLNQLHKPVHAVIQVKITIQGFQCGCFSVIPHRGILGRGIGFGIPSPSENRLLFRGEETLDSIRE